ncbi:tetratricopeptide repeat protein [Nocardia sp. NPDC127579]|uniref:tetratricopeptide repeat protein n=1 Tax=Nocardia sp. NPDC127579 TaxID=3345402 RepID=UPI00363313E5
MLPASWPSVETCSSTGKLSGQIRGRARRCRGSAQTIRRRESMSIDLRQLIAGLCLLIAVVAVPMGLVITTVGTILAFQDPDAEPTCDGEVMTPGTECWSFGDSVGVTSYEQAVEAHRRGRESSEGMLPIGLVVVGAGLAAVAGFKWGTRASTGSAAPSVVGAPQHQRPRAVDQTPDRRPSFAELDALATSALAQDDLDGALHWMQRAAEAGDAVAMNNLARLLQNRISRQSRPQRWQHRHRNRGDLIEAGLWFRRAAVAGNRDAMNSLATLLHKDGNAQEAELWRHRAAAPNEPATSIAAPSRSTRPPVDDLNALLTLVLGSRATAERLIDFEQRNDPAADRATAIDRAAERLRADRQRQG